MMTMKKMMIREVINVNNINIIPKHEDNITNMYCIL